METKNPFQPLIFSEDIMVTVKEDGENKKVDAKRYCRWRRG
jgi:hypothetical protein